MAFLAYWSSKKTVQVNDWATVWIMGSIINRPSIGLVSMWLPSQNLELPVFVDNSIPLPYDEHPWRHAIISIGLPLFLVIYTICPMTAGKMGGTTNNSRIIILQVIMRGVRFIGIDLSRTTLHDPLSRTAINFTPSLSHSKKKTLSSYLLGHRKKITARKKSSRLIYNLSFHPWRSIFSDSIHQC